MSAVLFEIYDVGHMLCYICFACKRFYITTLMIELGIPDRTNKASAYEDQQYSPDAVTGDHTCSMYNKFYLSYKSSSHVQT